MTLDLNDLQRRNGADPDWRDIRDGAARLEDVTDENSRYEAEVLLEYEAAHRLEQRVLGQFLRMPRLLDTVGFALPTECFEDAFHQRVMQAVRDRYYEGGVLKPDFEGFNDSAVQALSQAAAREWPFSDMDKGHDKVTLHAALQIRDRWVLRTAKRRASIKRPFWVRARSTEEAEALDSLVDEQLVLGFLLSSPVNAELLITSVVEDDFQDPGHETLFGVIQDLWAQGSEVTLLSVGNILGRTPNLMALGGLAYLRFLSERQFRAEDVFEAAGRLHRAGKERRKADDA